MKKIEQIRLENARRLADGFRTLSEFAHKIDRSPTQVSRFMGKNPTKKIGSLIARDIENRLDLPSGYLDNEHPALSHSGSVKEGAPSAYFRDLESEEEKSEILVPHFDVRAAMGSGCVPPDYADVIKQVTLTRDYLASIRPAFTTASNLAVVTGWGTSMIGTINHGDPVLVDRGVTQFVGDGVYLFTWDNLLYLKRLQKGSKEHFTVISDGGNYEPFLVPIHEVVVHARAILVWAAKAL